MELSDWWMGNEEVSLNPSAIEDCKANLRPSIDIDKNLGLSVFADPVLFAAVIMMRQPYLDILSALLDFVDTPERDGVEDEALAGIRKTPRIRHALLASEGRGVIANKLAERHAGPYEVGAAAR
jgi:hypothetical protein